MRHQTRMVPSNPSKEEPWYKSHRCHCGRRYNQKKARKTSSAVDTPETHADGIFGISTSLVVDAGTDPDISALDETDAGNIIVSGSLLLRRRSLSIPPTRRLVTSRQLPLFSILLVLLHIERCLVCLFDLLQ